MRESIKPKMINNQKEVFLGGEGDNYFYRNSGTNDPYISSYADLFGTFDIKPKRVLEIGCGDAQKLQMICEHYGESLKAYGIEPSAIAVENASKNFPKLNLQVGTADDLPFENAFFDVVIFGGCLYLCDRSLLFKIAAEADRVLCHSGHLIISDFIPPFPYRNTYKHQPGIYTYKMDYCKMFLWNPEYTLVGRISNPDDRWDLSGHPENRWGISVLKKSKFETNCPIVDPFAEK